MTQYKNAEAVTPHDTNPNVFDAIMVGTTAGNVQVKTAAGDTVVLTGLQKGVVVPIATTLIFSTNLTAAGITGFRK